MKSVVKILSIVFFSIVFIISGTSVYAYFWLSNWSEICSDEEMRYNAQNINKTERLPPNFYRVWDKLFPDSRNVSMVRELKSILFYGIGLQSKQENCRCDDIGYNSWNNHRFKWKYRYRSLLETTAGYTRFGFGLSEYSSPDKCFDFWINHDFYFAAEDRYFNGLDEFTQIVYQKNIDKLSDDELIEVIAYRVIGTYRLHEEERFYASKAKLIERWNEVNE